MKKIAIACIAALALAGCVRESDPQTVAGGAQPQRVMTPQGNMAVCNDGHLETTWDRALACNDRIYVAGGTGSKIWIDPEFKCEYFLSEFYDGSSTRIGPGAPRMAIINNEYIHVCRQ